MNKTAGHKVPPYRAVTRHKMFPESTLDEAARFDFITHMNKFLSSAMGPGNKLVYERRVLPEFRKNVGRDPKDRFEIRHAMNRDPFHQLWSASKRNTMEMRQQNGRAVVLRQIDELDARARDLNADSPNLQLDPTVEVPRYQSAVDIHCMPGCYHGEERPGDVSAGANYDCGIFATTAGALGGLSDGGGQAVVEWLRRNYPNWKPRRVLDIGCTIGHNVVPLALAFPETEFIAIDTAAASLRYGHARAKALGAKNITFIQHNGEDLSRWSDGHFDWVQTTMFLHELSGKALPRIIREGFRVLAPHGLMLHVEQPQYSPEMPLYEQFIRDWDAFNNNEPFWSAMHGLDLKQQMVDAGFGKDDLFVAAVKAVADRAIFPEAATDETEDHGRAAAWHAYGAWKGGAPK